MPVGDATAHWQQQFPPGLILVPEQWKPATGETTYGTYLVYQKLVQHPEKFKMAGSRRKGVGGDTTVIGRHRNGEPLGRGAGRRSLTVRALIDANGFDYRADPDGTKCPLDAHVRVMNGRTKADRASFIARRGQTFGSGSWARGKLTIDGKVVSLPPSTTRAGLLFIALNADIAKQFKALHERANGKVPGVAQRDQIPDQLLSLDEPANRKVRNSSGNEVELAKSVPRSVELVGGEYFFVPSIPFLQYVASLPRP